MKPSAQSASIRIACNNEQLLIHNKFLETERRLHDLRLAASGNKPPSGWQWIVIRDISKRMDRLQRWLRHQVQEVDSLEADTTRTIPYGRRWFTMQFAPACLAAVRYVGHKLGGIEVVMEDTKQRVFSDQLRGNIAITEQELSTLTITMEQIPRRVALARRLDEKQVRQILKDMSIEEARDKKRQYLIAESRLSLVMDECHQVMQERMHQEQQDQ